MVGLEGKRDECRVFLQIDGGRGCGVGSTYRFVLLISVEKHSYLDRIKINLGMNLI